MSIAIAVAVALVAGTVSGLTGFGFVLVSVTPLLLLFAPATVVPVALMLNFLVSAVVAAEARGAVAWRTVLALLPPACAGLYLGALALRALDAPALKLVVSVVVAGFALLLLTGLRLPRAHSPWATAVAGLTSGALTTTTGLSGPPIVALFAGREYAPQPFRASAAAFFLPLDLFGLAALIAQDGVHRAEWTLALTLAPAALLGTALGRHASRRISVALFRQVVLGLLLLTGVVGGVASLAALLR